MKRASSPSSSRARARTPRPIRWTARAAIVSLIVAVGALVLTGVVPAGAGTAVLKAIFLAAAATATTALGLWVIFSGLYAMFARRPEHNIDPSGDLW